MLFFAFSRTIYLIYLLRELVQEQTGFVNTVATYWHALKVDLATTCYIMFIPFFLLVVQSIYSPKWFNSINKIYTAILITAYSFITGAELGIYHEWETKLHFKGLLYLTNPSEIYNSAETLTFFILLAIVVFQIGIAIFAYNRWFYINLIRIKRNFIFSFLFLIITPGLLVLGARGGIQPISINLSDSYFSKHNILNLAATNSAYNLYISIDENYKNMGKNPFEFYDMDVAGQVVDELYKAEKDTTVSILSTEQPNIVLLIMESWTGDLIESLGGDPGITPEFNNLEKGGILFTGVYSSGTRSEQGMGCILGGFPALPISSITVQPDKYAKLSSINEILIDHGYSTSFYYGGQLVYGNMKSYIYYNGFHRIKEIYDFDDDLPRGKLGIHDEFVMDEQLNDLESEKNPFFSVIFTLSTHSPFDMPLDNPVNWGYDDSWGANREINDYLNSAYYTDQCLGEYFQKARQQSWFENTLFIIMSDHSHHSYRNQGYHSPGYHLIPLFFYGEVIKEEFRGKKINKIGSQTDLAATLLQQLGMDFSSFNWSKDLLNPYTPEFAYVAFEEGIGWIRPSGYFFYDKRVDVFYCKEINPSQEEITIKEGKSFLQMVYQDYLDY